jgi:hypothetical protein
MSAKRSGKTRFSLMKTRKESGRFRGMHAMSLPLQGLQRGRFPADTGERRTMVKIGFFTTGTETGTSPAVLSIPDNSCGQENTREIA